MVRELGPVTGGDRPGSGPPLGQRFGERAMQALALARQEVVIGRFLEEGVAKRISALGVDAGPRHEDLAPDGRPERFEERRVPHRGDAGKEVVVDPPPGDGRHTDDGLRRLRQPHDPGEQDLAERRRQATGPVLAGHEQLLDEERIAVRAAMDVIGEVRCRRRPEDRGEQLPGLARRQALEVEALDVAAPADLGQPRQQRVAPMELVGPERHHEDDTICPQLAEEERDRVASRRVCPVEVLDDEEHGLGLRQPLERAEHGVEKAGLVRLALRRARRSRP